MSEELELCKHENTKFNSFVYGTPHGDTCIDYEICLACGLSRSIWEQGSSDWMLNAYALKQEFITSPWTLIVPSDDSTLPEEGQEVLILTDYGMATTCTYRDKSYIRICSCRRCDGMSLGSVIKWMPIPELPCGKEAGR